MTEKVPLYTVGMAQNNWAKLHDLGGEHGKRPEWLYYCDGPGGPGPHGVYMNLSLYFDTAQEVERMIPMLELAYRQGIADKLRSVQQELGIKR